LGDNGDKGGKKKKKSKGGKNPLRDMNSRRNGEGKIKKKNEQFQDDSSRKKAPEEIK